MIKWILTKIVGTKNQREVRRLRPIVEQIVSIEESWNGKGQDFLLEKTKEWQGYLHRFLPMELPPVRIVEDGVGSFHVVPDRSDYQRA